MGAFGEFQYPTPPLAIYPEDVISHHRSYIARRRQHPPSKEYRDLAPEEWDEFIAHVELRKVALGVCTRDFGTACVHEHTCVQGQARDGAGPRRQHGRTHLGMSSFDPTIGREI
ncbi:hypothetical protein [Streptomyces sp. ME19-01-6]|uniref:hypothetical protein n=1 Tax=Streptomyces sp. ME19-01-6 TaxID=3028686 RepID=UPI0029A1F74D|nr:hypothetical protein [Streptomyces sp. ME19-01-6]MDX3234042.1 hypothetical protein [Streptomyces sp. ME19-01-6]